MSRPIAAVDVAGLQQLSRDFDRLSRDILKRELRVGLRAAAMLVADAARVRASAFSTRIPASIRSSVTQKGAAVRAGGDAAPHAGVFEGTASGRDAHHPVFARGPRSSWTWVAQPARPYMVPALNEHVEEVAEMVGDLLVRAFEEIHFV